MAPEPVIDAIPILGLSGRLLSLPDLFPSSVFPSSHKTGGKTVSYSNSTKPEPVSLRPAQDFILANWIKVGNEHFFTLKAVGAKQNYQFSSLEALLDFMRAQPPQQREN